MKFSDYPCIFRTRVCYGQTWCECEKRDEDVPLLECKFCKKREIEDKYGDHILASEISLLSEEKKE